MTEEDTSNAAFFILRSINLPIFLAPRDLEMCCFLDLGSKEKFNLISKTSRYFWLISHPYGSNWSYLSFLLAPLLLIQVVSTTCI